MFSYRFYIQELPHERFGPVPGMAPVLSLLLIPGPQNYVK